MVASVALSTRSVQVQARSFTAIPRPGSRCAAQVALVLTALLSLFHGLPPAEAASDQRPRGAQQAPQRPTAAPGVPDVFRHGVTLRLSLRAPAGPGPIVASFGLPLPPGAVRDVAALVVRSSGQPVSA